MKASDLRIGNLVNEIDIAFTITEIYKYGVQLENDSIPLLYSRIHEIEPIPLTEEWLLKFGFKKWINKKIYTYKRVSIYLHSIDGLAFGKASQRTKLQYVHQLQNLYFALTGEELTLKDI